jgi:secondary thiamine-phosphate synthase enzyme
LWFSACTDGVGAPPTRTAGARLASAAPTVHGGTLPAVKHLTEYLEFETQAKRELVRVTDTVAQLVRKSTVKEGMVLVSAMHITAGVFVNDNEPGLFDDLWSWLEHLAPEKSDYRHHQTGEDNGDAHLKSLLVHHQVIVPITKGQLDLGPWQQIFYAEFDGQRRKRVIVKVMGD